MIIPRKNSQQIWQLGLKNNLVKIFEYSLEQTIAVLRRNRMASTKQVSIIQYLLRYTYNMYMYHGGEPTTLQQYSTYISLTYMSLIFSPRTTPIERSTMKGLLRPKLDLHLSDNDPKIGVRKKPMSGDKHQIRVMCS